MALTLSAENNALKLDMERFDWPGGILGGPFKTKTVALAEVLFCRLGVHSRGQATAPLELSQRRLSGNC